MKNTIKGGEFIVKETNANNVFIVEDFTEEQSMMKESVIEFIDREVWPHKERFEKKDYAFTEELMVKAGEMGFLSIAVPENYGGMGMSFMSTILVCDYISGATGSFATAFGAHTGIGTMPIVLYGTEEQKQKYVPKLTTGEWFGSYCLTEPGAGSDANSGKTKAVLSDDGTHYKISGQKMWISNAGFCSLMIVFARIENDKNLTAFIVEYDKENPNGITMGEEEKKLGIRASSTRQVFYNETVVPVENMLSERQNGFKIALNILNIGRIKLAAACLDASRRIINNAVNYANERKQFGTSIANFGAIQEKIALMCTKTFVTESGVYRAAGDIQNKIDALISKGMPHANAELKGVEDFALECAILKVYGSEVGQFNADEGLQIYGGMGFSEDTPMEGAWRDARISRIYEGTNEINRLLSIGMLMKKALKGEIDLMTPAMSVANDLMAIPSFETPDYSILFSEEKEVLNKLKKTFLMIAGKAVEKFGMDLEKQQEIVLCAAEILIEIYMAESTLLKTEKLAAKTSEKETSLQIAMTQLNLFNAVETINRKGKEAIISFTEGDEQRMLLMGLKRFTKYQNYPNIVALKKEIAAVAIAKNEYPC
ncbi:alkylation response protein AidB-like acyl-CoA dehydrogenase [Wenyingzhuangia heitensis]|uniref:Alkylation response protein AidB-like acyl-CoA dehydrogenase n=1 Tax=Wenyingzhuangia heitensis TaxID=1487859 RepID=A0ABX0UDM8_9FLAO|nr:acyl-CoA dehydrogenase family protein [Wenyingzhuangia heitensis]NIJ46449.1 alkylation response protein AidB-like acyl-CoA dehydrogenase [Wenyingzhuangia heitensis]